MNDALIQRPAIINEDPLGVGWIVRLSSLIPRYDGESHMDLAKSMRLMW